MMRIWRPFEGALHRVVHWRHERIARRALALHLRGEARPDGLQLIRVRNRLEIRWRSRHIHPWDRDERPERQTELFHDQLIADTEAAILRLFQALPHIDWIDLQVLEPDSDSVVLSGTVHRTALGAVRKLLSVRMRLRQLGVEFRPLDSLQ
jgi:hypothetical protein